MLPLLLDVRMTAVMPVLAGWAGKADIPSQLVLLGDALGLQQEHILPLLKCGSVTVQALPQAKAACCQAGVQQEAARSAAAWRCYLQMEPRQVQLLSQHRGALLLWLLSQRPERAAAAPGCPQRCRTAAAGCTQIRPDEEWMRTWTVDHLHMQAESLGVAA